MRKYVKSNDGYALVIALLVITVVTVLGLGILTTTSSSKKLSEEESKDQTAYYIAEAGLNQKKEELKDAKVIYDDFVNSSEVKGQKLTKEQFVSKLRTFVEGRLSDLLKPVEYGTDLFKRKNAKANVKTVMTVSETELKFTITSTGIIKSNDSTNEKKRTVQSVDSYKLTITEKPAEEEFGFSKYAIHAINNLDLSNGSIIGNLGFSGPQPSDIKYPFTSNSGSVSYTGSTSGTTYRPCSWWKENNICGDSSYQGISTAIKNKDVTFNDSKMPKIPDFPINKFISLNDITNPNLPNNIQQGIPNKNPIPSGNYKVSTQDFYKNSLNIGKSNVNFYIEKADFDYRDINIEGEGNISIFSNSFSKGSGNINFFGNSINIYTKGNFSLSGSAILKSANNINIYSADEFSQSGSSHISNAKNLNIYSNKVTFGSSSTMNMTEKVNIFAYDSLKLNNTTTINSKETNIYYTGNNKPTINGGFENAVNLDFLYAPIDINGGIKLSGNIILRGDNDIAKKDVRISGGSSTKTPLYFYAPKFNINVSGGGEITGALIGNNITMSGGTKVIYQKPNIDNDNSGTGGGANGQIDSSLTPNSDSGSIEVNNP
ncbi:MAG: pilus assembly PilX N-terminal domain-containing protein [Kurthia gibsonii]